MQKHIYTAGYAGRSPQALRRLAESHDATVLDIRMSPRSREPEWNRGPLERLLGERYRHLPAFGNKNYRGDLGDGVMLSDPQAGIQAVRDEPRTVILLCTCWSHARCHRSTVADLLRSQGYSVEELRW